MKLRILMALLPVFLAATAGLCPLSDTAYAQLDTEPLNSPQKAFVSALPPALVSPPCPSGLAGTYQLQAEARPAGLLTAGEWQASLSLQSKLPLAVLKALLKSLRSAPHNSGLSLEQLDWQTENHSYQLQVLAQQWVFWDRFQLQFQWLEPHTLKISPQHNWFPTDSILSRLQKRLTDLPAGFKLQIERKPEHLLLYIPKQELQLSRGKQVLSITQLQPLFITKPDGELQLELTSAPLPSLNAQPNPQQLKLALKGCLDQGGFFAADSAAQAELRVAPQDLQQVRLGAEPLSERYLASGEAQISARSELQGQLSPWALFSSGQLQIQLPRLEVEQQHYQQIRSVPFHWHYHFPYDLEIWPQLPPLPSYQSQTRANQLTLFINGPAYYAEIKPRLLQARESIDQEIFTLYAGQTTRELAHIYALKAMGLHRPAPGQLAPDPYAPQGIRVFLLHSHKLTVKGAQEIVSLFAQAGRELLQEVAQAPNLPENLATYRRRYQQHFQISAWQKGVFKSDHRKLLVIDGTTAYTGGLNLADFYLLPDSFHDLMVRVQGPAVSQMHQLFIDNWQELNPGKAVNWNLKSPTEQQSQLSSATPLSQVQVLSTDDRSQQIAAALLQVINSAQHQLRIEHAYIYDQRIEQALQAALKRGVKLEIIVSERSDESVFEVLNPVALLKLLQQGQPGQVSCWLYQGQGGNYDYMSHTKFLSADGQRAIVGSANLIPRSLHSPFEMNGQQVLFNEELSLYIDDPVFVKELDTRLFQADTEHSRKVGVPELEQLLQQRGGELQVLLERLKGLLS